MSDQKITPTLVDGEVRILDTDLAERLGFERLSDIRKLIERHRENLSKISVLATVAQTPGAQGGRPSTAFYLNRKQAIFITAKSETETATDTTIEIIERFDAYERGAAVPSVSMTEEEMIARSLILVQAKVERLAIENAQQAQQLVAAQIKVAGFDRIANSEGKFQLRVAAKLMDWQEKKFIEALHAREWIYKLKTGGNWIAHADKLRAGLLAHKSYTYTDEVGEERTKHQVFVTAKGLARLALILGASLQPFPGTLPANVSGVEGTA